MVTGVGLLLVAAALLVAGAEMFAENAGRAGTRLGVTSLAVGLLLAGAEPEELVTAVLAAGAARPDLAAGDALGANITMLTLALGAAAVARPLPVGPRVRGYAGASALAGLAALAVVADGRVGRAEGGALVAIYVVGVVAVWRRERRPPVLGELAELPELGEPAESPQLAGRSAPTGERAAGGRSGASWTPLLLLLLGIALMTAGGWAAVAGAIRAVDSLGVDDSVVGLTLLALATTAELFALVWAAARRGVDEVAVAGIVGSAAYNSTITLGGAALVRPLELSGLLGPALLAAALPLVVVTAGQGGRLNRGSGAVLSLGYVGFVAVVLA